MNEAHRQGALHNTLVVYRNFPHADQSEVRRLYGLIWERYQSKSLCKPDDWSYDVWRQYLERFGCDEVNQHGDDYDKCAVVITVVRMILTWRGN